MRQWPNGHSGLKPSAAKCLAPAPIPPMEGYRSALTLVPGELAVPVRLDRANTRGLRWAMSYTMLMFK